MNRSFLIDLAYKSIEEILQATAIIDQTTILKEYPILGSKLPMKLSIYVKDELHGSYTGDINQTLLHNIIFGAKIAAFEKEKPLTVSDFLQAEIEITLQTADQTISYRA